jgi:hypothetical protein
MQKNITMLLNKITFFLENCDHKLPPGPCNGTRNSPLGRYGRKWKQKSRTTPTLHSPTSFTKAPEAGLSKFLHLSRTFRSLV